MSPAAATSTTADTAAAGVIGHPVAHSLSPVLYNAAFKHLDMDWTYEAWDVPPGDGESFVAGIAQRQQSGRKIAGLSVTMPHKQAAFAACATHSETALALQAVNCVHNLNGDLVGHNTDGDGLVAALTKLQGLELAGLSATIVGAGGAARAAALALCMAGANVAIVNRSQDKAVSAAEMVTKFASKTAGKAAAAGTCTAAAAGSGTASDAGLNTVPASQLVINATPLGMSPTDPLPINPEQLTSNQVLVDLIYSPAQTPLLAAAKSQGLSVANGVGMLLYQAAQQFQIWTGQAAPVEVMARAAGLSLE